MPDVDSRQPSSQPEDSQMPGSQPEDSQMPDVDPLPPSLPEGSQAQPEKRKREVQETAEPVKTVLCRLKGCPNILSFLDASAE
eukprot:4226098-Alexandrium_andersonii.AAC.1